MSKTLPFTYHGSKFRSFNFINSKLPRTRQYVEPFGGAGTILLNRNPVPVETYNDLHEDIPHFFRVLRDQPRELIGAVRKTPYSRDEYAHAIEQRRDGYPDCSDIERARLFFTIMQQSRSHRQHSGTGAWSYETTSTRGRGSDNTTAVYKRRVDELSEIAGRLTDVQIESREAIDVIESQDSDVAVFYVDPPYVRESRGSSTDYYGVEMSDEDHQGLATVLRECDGYVCLSGYGNGLYDGLFSDWEKHSAIAKSQEGEAESREVLWTNYDADGLGGQKIGDWPEPTRKGKQLTLTGAVESEP